MEHTAKHFALQLGALIALYVSLIALISIAFGIITILFPDAADYYFAVDIAQGQVRVGIALLVVFFPTYLILTQTVNRLRRTAGGAYLTLTKWLIYLSLLVGGGILLGDLVSVIAIYLGGDITVRFLLKALVLFVAIGAAFAYYMLDARGYWLEHKKCSRRAGAAAVLVALVILVLGVMNIDTPAAVRQAALDDRQIEDLDGMQWHINEYYTLENRLPENLAVLYESGQVPEAPDGREAYSYQPLDETTFELCATFAEEQRGRYGEPRLAPALTARDTYNWDHGAGRVCFTRVVFAESESI
jgi:hypothetical protein